MTLRADSNTARRVLRWLMEQDKPASVADIVAAIKAPMPTVANVLTRHPEYFVRCGHRVVRGQPRQLWLAWEE